MDISVLKTLLAAQEQAYKTAMEIFMKDVNERCKQLETTVKDLRTSLEFSQNEIDDLKHQLSHLKHGSDNDKQIISKLAQDQETYVKRIEDLQARCNYQEDYNRRNNLQFVGIDEDMSETWEQSAQKVRQLLEEKLQLPNIQLERAHRVGQLVPNRQRPIIARFTRFCDREAVLRNLGRLRGSRIYVNEDLCPASQEIKRAQLPLLKQARSEGKVAFFRHTKLITKDRRSTGATSNAPEPRDVALGEQAAADVMNGGGTAGSGRYAAGGTQTSTNEHRGTLAMTVLDSAQGPCTTSSPAGAPASLPDASSNMDGGSATGAGRVAAGSTQTATNVHRGTVVTVLDSAHGLPATASSAGVPDHGNVAGRRSSRNRKQ